MSFCLNMLMNLNIFMKYLSNPLKTIFNIQIFFNLDYKKNYYICEKK